MCQTKVCTFSREYGEIKRLARFTAMFQTHPQLSGIIIAQTSHRL